MSELDIEIPLRALHPKQKQILKEAKRFNTLKCGRRFGKTELAYELTIDPALDGYPTAYFAPIYKDVSEFWMNLKGILHPIIKSKDESIKQLRLITGGVIDMWSLEDVDAARGRKYKRVVIDEGEKAKNLKDSWERAIRQTLADYMGDAWFLSTPKFGKTYFKDVLFKNQEKYDDWKGWKFTSYDNPHINPSELDAMSKQIEDIVFQCEILAEDIDLVLSRFATKFDRTKHVVPEIPYDDSSELYISFDFNVEPGTALISQYIDEEIRFIDEVRIMNSDTSDICDEILTRYPDALYMVTADASGDARTSIIKNLNHFSIIKSKLQLMDSQFKVNNVNPSVRLTRILVNSLLQHFTVKFSEKNCPYTIEDMLFVEVKEDGEIDKNKDKHKGHLLDNVRYTCHAFHKHLIKYIGQKEIEFQQDPIEY